MQSRKASCHGKIEGLDDASISRKRGVPGPGTYEEPLRMDPMGKYASSTYNNSKASNFNTGRRFKSPAPGLATPGPGTYELPGNTVDSHQVASNFHSILTRTLRTTEKRPPDFTRFKTPGPGSYRPPSDFGYIDCITSPRERKPSPFAKDKNGTSITDFDRSVMRKTHNGSF